MSIKVENLTHIYNKGMPEETVALDNVSFEIHDGEFVGVIGHTGSGKSTLLQHLNGLLKPDSGNIFINDEEITAPGVPLIDIRKKIGLVFQYPEYQLFEESVKTDVAFGPKNLGLSDEDIELRVMDAIDLVGLDYAEIANFSPFDLSGGQKRRVAIAGVIAMKPQILILDEPTAGLDPRAHQDILNMIDTIHERMSGIIILVSHNMNDIARLSDRVLVMDRGKLAINGSPEEVFKESDRLSEMGLALPDVTCLMNDLTKRGIDVPKTVFSIDEAEKILVEKLRNKK